jgi:hypothetical protein
MEAKYNTTPKSPGTSTWSSQYATMVPSDAYRDQMSPPAHYGPRSPPMNSPGYGTYPGAGSPLMSSVDGTQGY